MPSRRPPATSAAGSLVAATLLASLIAGCSGGDEGRAVEAFTAEIWTQDRQIGAVTLAGPVQVKDGFGEDRPAYALTERYFAPSFSDRTQYLDGSLGVVRQDRPCQSDTPCSRASASWDNAGQLPELGYGWPLLVESDGAPTVLADRPVLFPAHASKAGGRLVLDVTILPGAPDELQETHEYEAGRLLPSVSTYDQGQLRFEYRDYQAGDVLPPIPDWPRPPQDLGPMAWAGTMFPGEAEDQFQVGMTHVDILRRAAGKSEALQAVLDHGCVQSYTLNFPRPSDGGFSLGTLLPRSDAVAIAQFTVLDDGGNGRNVVAQVTRDAFGVMDVVVTRDDPVSEPPGCALLRRSPWPQESASSFLQRAQGLHLKAGRMLFFSFRMASQVVGAERLPEQGLALMQLHYVPPSVDENQSFVSFDTYAVSSWANQHRLSVVYADPEDIAIH